jgi:hypothetical protein
MIEINYREEIRKSYKELIDRLSVEEKRVPYHLITVYQDRKCFEHTRNIKSHYCMSSIFSKFYVSRILPYILNTSNITRYPYCELQPITFVFPERHKDRNTFHHHSVICSSRETTNRLDILCEKELIDIFPFKNIQSVMLTKRDTRIMNYVSKSYSKTNDDILIFSNKEIKRT